MLLQYKIGDDDFTHPKFLNYDRQIKKKYFKNDKLYIFENKKETDQAFLDVGVPDYSENIINGNDVEISIDQLARFCLTQDFLQAYQLFDPLFISSIINLIDNQDSLDFHLIILVRNMWGQPIENIEILYDKNIVSSFCKYLCAPLEFRDFVYESFNLLLSNVPKDINPHIINILMDFNIMESLDEYFDFINSIDYSLVEPDRLQRMAERSIHFIRSLTFNQFFDSDFLPNIIFYSVTMLSNENFQTFTPILISILHHAIIDLDRIELFISNQDNLRILVDSHFFNNIQINSIFFSKIYQIDSNLWKYENCREIYLNDSRFIDNIGALLIDPNFNDYLKPVFIFLNNSMVFIWDILYSTQITYKEEKPQPLIYIILDHSNNGSLNTKIIAGLCISSFMMEADMDEKRDIAFNGGFNSLCFMVSTAEGHFQKSMLKCILMLLSLFPELLEDELSIDELGSALDSFNITEEEEETFSICYEIGQLIQPPQDET